VECCHHVLYNNSLASFTPFSGRNPSIGRLFLKHPVSLELGIYQKS
jgi:hypothetical protein